VFRGIDCGEGVSRERQSDKGVSRAVNRAAKATGLDVMRCGGQSLWAGLGTNAAAAGASDRTIARQISPLSQARGKRAFHSSQPAATIYFAVCWFKCARRRRGLSGRIVRRCERCQLAVPAQHTQSHSANR